MASLVVQSPLAPPLSHATERAAVLSRAKGAPSLFLRRPEAGPDLSPQALVIRQRIADGASPAHELFDLYPTLRRYRKLAREVLLTAGYLYAEDPALAHALTQVVRLPHLFEETELFIQRGAEVLRVVRKGRGDQADYFHEDGTDVGAPAKIFLFDRVVTDTKDLAQPLHRSLTDVQRELGFTELELRHVTEQRILAAARYGDTWVKTLFNTQAVRATLECEAVPDNLANAVAEQRALAKRKEAYVQVLRDTVQVQITEQLPFDEPKTEVGQQDGKLRQHWKWAYRYGHSQFTFNEDEYRVFDRQGRPRVPQVCIDFITDTFERASGSWYSSKGQPRGRQKGLLNFDDLEVENIRSVESFLQMAAAKPEWFELWHLPREQQIPFRRRKEFYSYLYEHRAQFEPGDVVVILGLRDDDKEHYHSFFVFESDPITHMPMTLASNAGRPRIRSWEDELSNAPKRSIRARLRPRMNWLEKIIALPSGLASEPAKPTAPPNK